MLARWHPACWGGCLLRMPFKLPECKARAAWLAVQKEVAGAAAGSELDIDLGQDALAVGRRAEGG